MESEIVDVSDLNEQTNTKKIRSNDPNGKTCQLFIYYVVFPFET